MKIDLHNHTKHSDGILTLDELAYRAKKNNVDIFALTDHDSVFGTFEVDEVERKYQIKIIKGMKRTIKYPVPLHNSVKEVVYFVAKYENQELAPIDSDILCAKKFTLEAALSVLKFSQIRDLLIEADYMLDLLGE